MCHTDNLGGIGRNIANARTQLQNTILGFQKLGRGQNFGSFIVSPFQRSGHLRGIMASSCGRLTPFNS